MLIDWHLVTDLAVANSCLCLGVTLITTKECVWQNQVSATIHKTSHTFPSKND